MILPGGGFVGDVFNNFPMVFFSEDPYDFLRFTRPEPVVVVERGRTLRAVRSVEGGG